MKKFFKWCREHFYEIWIFLAGVYYEKAIWYWDKDNWKAVILYIFMSVLFLIDAKMEKNRYGK